MSLKRSNKARGIFTVSGVDIAKTLLANSGNAYVEWMD